MTPDEQSRDSVAGDTNSSPVPITELPAAELLRLIRMYRCDEQGEPYDPWQVGDEIRRRGMPILTALGWPNDWDAIYRNRYTGDSRRLVVIMADWSMASGWDEDLETAPAAEILAARDKYLGEWRPGEPIEDELPSIIEHWAPEGIWTDADLLDDYHEAPAAIKTAMRAKKVKPMNGQISAAAKEYQDALRDLEEVKANTEPFTDSSIRQQAQERFERALLAYNAEKAALQSTGKTATTSELTEAIEASSHDMTAAEKPSELQIVKQQLRAANQTLKGLRARNKELHDELARNIAEKKRLNYDVIPELRRQKKGLSEAAPDAS